MNETKLDLVNSTFAGLFDQVVDVLLKTMTDEDPLEIRLPDEDSLNRMSAVEIAQLVAKTSNIYSKASRLAGMAKQEVKRAQHVYNYAYKTNKVGGNEDERTANALKSSEQEANQLNFAERIYAHVEEVASAARVASESARKILDKIESLQLAEAREDHGQQRMNDTHPKEFNF